MANNEVFILCGTLFYWPYFQIHFHRGNKTPEYPRSHSESDKSTVCDNGNKRINPQLIFFSCILCLKYKWKINKIRVCFNTWNFLVHFHCSFQEWAEKEIPSSIRRGEISKYTPENIVSYNIFSTYLYSNHVFSLHLYILSKHL